MTAIYGIIGESDASELASMGERLAHRGPRSLEWSPAPGVRLGERVGNGNTESPGFLAFDGALDNAEELLGTRGVTARVPQAVHVRALVAETFNRFGPDGFARLSGQFAVALWDNVGQRLVMARDRWGARALFYGMCCGRLVFASEYKALLPLPDFPARHNPDAMLFALRTHHTAPETCFLADAAVVPQGAWLIIERARMEHRCFWDIAVDIAARSKAAHALAVRSTLLQALRRQMGVALRSVSP